MAALQIQRMCFGLQSARKPRKLPGKSNHTMGRRNIRDRISTGRPANSACRSGVSELIGQLPIGSGLSIWDSEQRLPDLLLKTRASHVERHRELCSFAGEVLFEFRFGLLKDRLVSVLDEIVKPATTRVLLLPEDGHQSLFAGDQL